LAGGSEMRALKKILFLVAMFTRKNSGTSFCYFSLFILLSCSKSDHTTNPPPPSTPFLNTFTYILTDTTGINHTYSDTSRLNPDSSYVYLIGGVGTPAAFIWNPYRDSNLRRQFFFSDPKSYGMNTLFFSLPYFQASLSGTAIDFLISPVSLIWEGVYYKAVQPQSPGVDPGLVCLASFTYSTNISDSTSGFVTGSFNISATTIDSGKIQITGKFSNLPTNVSP
jgi:hypothetical protein